MKSFGTHLLVLLLSYFLVAKVSGRMSLNDYINQFSLVDESALIMCWMIDGTVSELETGNPVKGHTCTGKIGVWTDARNPNHAREFCESKFPFHILKAESLNTGGIAQTECVFHINLICDRTWYQIHNKCYRVIDQSYTFEKAQQICSGFKSGDEWNARVAHYYSDYLGIAFSDLDIKSVWVTVPDIKEHFENGEGELAVFVQDAAYKYDTKPGTLILPEGDEGHQALCEYTPPMTKAEMYYMAEKYSEIYPIRITSSGASISTSSYLTINSVPGSEDSFKVDDIKAACKSIGAILNTNSFPLISILEEWKDAKEGLNNHRFYMTAAFKNEGCSRRSYMDWDSDGKVVEVFAANKGSKKNDGYCHAHSFVFSKMVDKNQEGRYPTPAAFRAPALCTLHTYGFEYEECPSGWHGFTRAQGTRFCHKLNNTIILDEKDAKAACHEMNAALSGFDSKDEFTFVQQLIKTKYIPPIRGPLARAETHFRLGGTYPCVSNCFDSDTKRTFTAGWDEGVSRDTKFLNSLGGNYPKYNDMPIHIVIGPQLSFRDDVQVFHLHRMDHYTYEFFICGKYAALKPKKHDEWQLAKTHA